MGEGIYYVLGSESYIAGINMPSQSNIGELQVGRTHSARPKSIEESTGIRVSVTWAPVLVACSCIMIHELSSDSCKC